MTNADEDESHMRPVTPEAAQRLIAFIEEQTEEPAARLGPKCDPPINSAQFSHWSRGETGMSLKSLHKIQRALGETRRRIYTVAGLIEPDDDGMPQPIKAQSLKDFLILAGELPDEAAIDDVVHFNNFKIAQSKREGS